MYQNTQDFQSARSAYRRLTEVAPQNSAGFYALGAIDWILVMDKSNPLAAGAKTPLIAEGLDSLDRALALNPQYDEAMAYKNLLLRQQAALAQDPAEAARLTAEADTWFNRSLETQKRNRAALNANAAVGVRGNTFAAPPPPPPQGISGAPIRIGGDVARSNLIQQVLPQYPAEARAARITGVVLLQATIDRNGLVANLQVISGHPLLNNAAVEAVRQWRYQPILLNGQPIDVITTITVNFSFSQ